MQHFSVISRTVRRTLQNWRGSRIIPRDRGGIARAVPVACLDASDTVFPEQRKNGGMQLHRFYTPASKTFLHIFRKSCPQVRSQTQVTNSFPVRSQAQVTNSLPVSSQAQVKRPYLQESLVPW